MGKLIDECSIAELRTLLAQTEAAARSLFATAFRGELQAMMAEYSAEIDRRLNFGQRRA